MSTCIRPLARAAILCGLCSLPGRPGGALADEGTAAKLRDVLIRLEASIQKLDRQRFDSDAIIEKVGRDPRKLCDWVREETSFAPYAGVLRGPRGVLLDRVGSDVDRALLLAQMVNASGYAVQLARVQLTEAEARQRLEAASGQNLPPINEGSDSKGMAALLERASGQADRLLKVVPAPAGGPAWDEESVRAAQDHWWVQYNDGKSWTDLDPALGKDAAGGHLGAGTPATITSALPNLAAHVPADLFHQVEVKVVVERWQGGRLLEDTALSWIVLTWRDPEIHIYLTHAFAHGADVIAAANDAGKLKAALLLEKTWQPLLTVDGRNRGPKTFDETGVLSDAPTGGAGGVGRGVRRGLGDAFGGGEAKVDAVLTAEWLDVTIKAAGAPPRTARREVFDSIGPAARAAALKGALPKPLIDEAARLRRALALAGSSDNLVVSCRFPVEYLGYRRARRLLDVRGDLLLAVIDRRAAGSQDVIGRSLDPDWLEMMNLGRGIEKGANSTYVDRPNVCRLITQLEIGGDGKVLLATFSDLAANSVAAAAPTGADRFAAVVRRGVADTLCEGIAVGRSGQEAGDTPVRTTADVFDRAGNTEWVVLRDPAGAAAAAPPLPPDVRQRVADELAAGNLVVLPKEPAGGRIGWWRVDPRSGRTVGVMDDGRCSDGPEYSETHIPGESVNGTVIRTGPRRPLGGWGDLADDIVRFRNPQTTEEFFKCWEEAYEILHGEWINPW